jgi:hypothetical protein
MGYDVCLWPWTYCSSVRTQMTFEWGADGIALLLRGAGISFAILDLTRGEMSSREHRRTARWKR